MAGPEDGGEEYTVRRRNAAESRDVFGRMRSDVRRGRAHLRELTADEAGRLQRSVRTGAQRRVERVAVPLDVELQFMSIRDVTFETVDTTARFGSLWIPRPATVERCRFVDTRFIGWQASRTTFRDCTFEEFRAATLWASDVTKSTFERCRFDRVRLGGTSFRGCAFRDVDIARWRAGGRHVIERSTFEDVRIEAAISMLYLIDCRFRATDLSAVRAKNFLIRGLTSVDDVLLPQHPDCFIVRTSDMLEVVTASVAEPYTQTQAASIASWRTKQDHHEAVDSTFGVFLDRELLPDGVLDRMRAALFERRLATPARRAAG